MMQKPRIIVVGSDIAGLMAALRVAELGGHVDLISAVSSRQTYVHYGHEGISAALNHKGEADSPLRHCQDTIKSGGSLTSQQAVQNMCEAAPGLINMLDRMGVPFQRTTEGLVRFFQTEEGGCHRMAQTGGITSQSILSALVEQVRAQEMHGTVTRFEGWECLSAILDEGRVGRGIVAMNINSMQVQSFKGDGVIVAVGENISSALYQQGAYYANGEFPQHGLWVEPLTHSTSLPGIYAVGQCAAHYHGGGYLKGNGLLADLFSGKVAGESVVHYIRDLEKNFTAVRENYFEDEVQKQISLNDRLLTKTGSINAHEIHERLSRLTETYMGETRNNKGLADTDEKIQELLSLWESDFLMTDQERWANHELIFARRLYHSLQLARVKVQSAFRRNESRGGHHKSEFPKQDDVNWLKTSKAQFTEQGPVFSYESVENIA
jgi:succinate dehydrogenase/fumarate reductase flavoprotein subunit